MAFSTLENVAVEGIATCVPPTKIDNSVDVEGIDKAEIRKVVGMAGIERRHVSDGTITSSDLCRSACADLLEALAWPAETVDALILVTQTPDYFLPSSSCLVHRDLGFPTSTAAFDVGLGCSGYPYGLWLGAMMLNSGLSRVIVMHGETPSLFCHPHDHSTTLLFGDAGSATALERKQGEPPTHFALHTDGNGFADLILPGRGFRNPTPDDEKDNYLYMNGANIFAFSLRTVPEIIAEVLDGAELQADDVDHFVLHQSNRFMMKHLAKKCGIDSSKVPIILEEFGNTGGASVPLTMTQGLDLPLAKSAKVLSIGYGVGLSWSAALFHLRPETALTHSVYATPPRNA